MDIVIRHCKLRDRSDLVDIAIRDGIIAAVEPRYEGPAGEEIDAAGRLVTPPLVDPHLHLDAVLTVGQPRFNESGTLLEGIAIWAERKAMLTEEDIIRRATEAVRWEVAQGVGFIRTHVDVCDPNLTALKALLQVKERVRHLCAIQIVAFPQEGILAYPGGLDLMREALRMGADVVGGIPHYEYTREDGVASVHAAFDLALEFDRLIDIHCDETDDPHSRFVETMVARTIRDGLEGRVTASHTTAMGSYNDAYAFKLMRLMAKAELHVITNPLDNIILQGRFDSYPKRRGLTRVKELLEMGVNVATGHDSIMDPWYPLGTGNMLQAAWLLLHVAHMSGRREMKKVFDTITDNAARCLGIADEYGIGVGKPANLVVLDAVDEIDALRRQAVARYVLHRGRVVAETVPSQSRVYEASGDVRDVTFRM
ncbi:Amidohydrolase 3 [Thermaerobacter marianensis DSM 12885]|uniref:Amidohydrolase 3 n=1 Tax=Thermaerobacter marianensis (strain ATCC 700841 / DSM 12885 / JCM 10246 / 7p75a) TaxID=644966 RepID=E6SGD8_THEM7|nr:Amidohydrolase 3 [Thermaerobacter marianensis DSM 12885]